MGVFKKGDRWYTDLYDSNGQRIRLTVKINGLDPSKISRREAEKVEAIRKADFAKGIELAIHKKDILLDQLIERFLEWATDNHKSFKIDKSICKNLSNYFKKTKVSKINLWQIEQYKSYRKKLGRCEETINKELGALRRMINLALEWGLISKNPIMGMKLLRVPIRKFRVIRDWEFQKLYDCAPMHFKPILLCAYFTGMRKGEIQKLKWKDVDLKEGYVTVAESKNNEYRTIPITNMLWSSLNRLNLNSHNEYVFNTRKGEPYKSDSAWKRVWNNTLDKSGIEKCRFHDLRHTFISNLIVDHKEDFATVMALSGHKDISMLKRYSHTRKEAKKRAINKLSDPFINKTTKIVNLN